MAATDSEISLLSNKTWKSKLLVVHGPQNGCAISRCESTIHLLAHLRQSLGAQVHSQWAVRFGGIPFSFSVGLSNGLKCLVRRVVKDVLSPRLCLPIHRAQQSRRITFLRPEGFQVENEQWLPPQSQLHEPLPGEPACPVQSGPDFPLAESNLPYCPMANIDPSRLH